jgi:uroporphyrinogen decarboxylase
MQSKMEEYYQDKEFFDKIGNHFCCIEPDYDWTEIKPGFFKDEYGVIWDCSVDRDIGNVVNTVIENTSDLDKFIFPDPKKPGRFDKFETKINKYPDRFVIGFFGFTLFERAWTLRGMENFLCDMTTDHVFVEELLDRITEQNLALIDICAKYKVDAMRFGDDFGQQNGLIMGPKFWRKFIKPRIAKMYEKVRSHGLKVFIHSCGDVEEIFPDLIEIGLDCFNPFQPEVFDIYKIKTLYGDKLSFYGGMSVQKVLPFGSPEEVKAETKKLIKEIGRNGGYICAPAHSTPKDVPVKNMLAMIEVLNDQK